MNKTLALFAFTFIVFQAYNSVSAQDIGEADSSSPTPRVARLELEPAAPVFAEPATPIFADADGDAAVNSAVDRGSMIVDDQPVAEVLDEKEAQLQGKILSDALRILGYAALLICAAIAGLIYYGKQQSLRKSRSQDW